MTKEEFEEDVESCRQEMRSTPLQDGSIVSINMAAVVVLEGFEEFNFAAFADDPRPFGVSREWLIRMVQENIDIYKNMSYSFVAAIVCASAQELHDRGIAIEVDIHERWACQHWEETTH